jgi:hypothetical protein
MGARIKDFPFPFRGGEGFSRMMCISGLGTIGDALDTAMGNVWSGLWRDGWGEVRRRCCWWSAYGGGGGGAGGGGGGGGGYRVSTARAWSRLRLKVLCEGFGVSLVG